MTATTWRAENGAWLTVSLRRLRTQMERLAAAQRESGGPTWLVAGDDTASGAAAAAAPAQQTPGFRAALQLVAELTDLSEFEQSMLLLAAAPALDGAFSTACAELHCDPQRDYPTLQLGLALFVPPEERLIAADSLMPTRPLRRLQLIETCEHSDEPLLLRRLGTDERMTNYLRGANHSDRRLEPYLAPLPRAVPSEPAHSTAERICAALQRDNETWPTINLTGPPGCVSLDAIVFACDTVGLEPRKLDIARFAETEPDRRALLVALLGREALLGRLAVVVDAVTISEPSAVATTEDLIRTLPAPLFVLSAERWASRSSHLRTIASGAVTRAQQVSLWQQTLATLPHSINGEINHIAQQFDLTPDAILDTIGRAAAAANGPISAADLWEACRDQRGTGLDELAHKIEPRFGWNDIVVGDSTRAQLRELADQVQHRATVYESWGFAPQFARGRGITALFAGVSGTGKTMAAEILAGELRLSLYRIDLAGVVSKYIGETEKNLRRVFDAAEHSGCILMFDEADALFGTRTEVRDSHDRYANLEINYLLQRMEDYAGLAILATNRRSALDSAFLRRLRFIVEFPFPTAADRRRIWERALPSEAQRGNLDYGQLARFEIAGGNIRSIAINAAFLAASEDSSIQMRHIAHAAAREYGKLSRPVTPAEFGDWLEWVPS